MDGESVGASRDQGVASILCASGGLLTRFDAANSPFRASARTPALGNAQPSPGPRRMPRVLAAFAVTLIDGQDAQRRRETNGFARNGR